MSESNLIGSVVDGRYRIDAVIGSGGFGTVYRALHVALGGPVAIKVPLVRHLPRGAIDSAIASFLDEGRVLKRLRHASLVAALDLGLLPPGGDGIALPYLVLEWCDGPALNAWLAARPAPLGKREAWRLLRPVVDAVAYAHEEGVVHRDLKPANILLESSRGVLVPRIIDFGIAKLLDPDRPVQEGATATVAGSVAYTPRYAAPEQLTGTRTGPRTDVYALALVLLEAIRGRPVFATDDDALAVLLEPEALSAARLGHDLGPWSAILARALSTRPEARQADAGELLRELDGEGAQTDDSASVPASVPGAPVAPEGAAAEPGREKSGRPPAARSSGWKIGVGIGVAAVVLGGAAWGTARILSAPKTATVQTADRPTDEAPALVHTATPGHSTGGASTPLRHLATTDLLARGLAGGLTGCSSTGGPGASVIMCSDGVVMTREGKFGGSTDADRIRMSMQYQAKMQAKMPGSGRAARFTTDDAMGIVVAASPAIIDTLMGRILDGVSHDAIGTEVAPPFQAPVPARLRDWTGMAMATRAEAAGLDLISVELAPGMASVSGSLNGEFITLMLIHGDSAAWVAAARRGPAAFSYASDGDETLASYGPTTGGTPAFVKTVLGTSSAAKTEKGR